MAGIYDASGRHQKILVPKHPYFTAASVELYPPRDILYLGLVCFSHTLIADAQSIFPGFQIFVFTVGFLKHEQESVSMVFFDLFYGGTVQHHSCASDSSDSGRCIDVKRGGLSQLRMNIRDQSPSGDREREIGISYSALPAEPSLRGTVTDSTTMPVSVMSSNILSEPTVGMSR